MIFIIAATSKIHLVDEALLRSGRFDLKLKIGLPDENDRVQLLQTFLEKVDIILYLLKKNICNDMI